MPIDEYRVTEWVPAIVKIATSGRTFLLSQDGCFCIAANYSHPLLLDDAVVECALLDEDELVVRARIEGPAKGLIAT